MTRAAVRGFPTARPSLAGHRVNSLKYQWIQISSLNDQVRAYRNKTGSHYPQV